MKRYQDFFRYVIPSMLAFALSGLYGIVDGFFLGNEMGDAALAAINVAYPITAFMQAVGTGIGMGGAVQYTIQKAQANQKNQEKCLGVTLLLLGAAGLLLTPVFSLFRRPLLRALGANGDLLILGSEYIKWISMGTLFQILGTGMVPLLRNVGNASLSMYAMVTGSVINIVFDYLMIWVWGYGMAGAAIASVMGQLCAFLVSVIYLLKKEQKVTIRRMDWSLIKKVICIGFSPFGLSFAPNITLILVNLNAVYHGGDFAVTCYAPISYITYTIMLLLQGVSDGAQPLISLYYGKGEKKNTRQVYRLSRNFSVLVGILAFAVLLWKGEAAVRIFGTSPKVTAYVIQILPLFLTGMVFAGISRAVISYFYATEENRFAYILIYGESLLLAAFLFILPEFMGIMGTWTSIMFSQICMALLAQFLIRVKK